MVSGLTSTDAVFFPPYMAEGPLFVETEDCKCAESPAIYIDVIQLESGFTHAAPGLYVIPVVHCFHHAYWLLASKQMKFVR